MPVWKKERGYWRQSEQRKLHDGRQKTRLTALAIWTNWGSARRRLGIQIAAHIQKRQPNEYDKAVTLLTDRRDLAVRQGRVTAFQSALRELRQEHAAKESLLRRLTKAKL
jgi:hypothetical protein